MKINYPDMKAALFRRGWIEQTDSQSLSFDLKFAYYPSELLGTELKSFQIINQNSGQHSLCCKQHLVDSLRECPLYWLTWLCAEGDTPIQESSQNCNLSNFQHGIDSFYPKSFKITNQQDFLEFQLYYWQIYCESYLKNFIQNSTMQQFFFKEKLIVCLSILKRKLADADSLIDSQIGLTGVTISAEEMGFLSKNAYPLQYLNHVWNEYWFIRIAKEIPGGMRFKKKNQRNALEYLKQIAIDQIEKCDRTYPQSKLNGSGNQWIVKPGHLSRGRNIKIINSFDRILAFTDILYYSKIQKLVALGSKTWVVQKYIENPLLILNRKFDIRAWVLVSSWNPLKIYLYKHCYFRFSAKDYDAKNFENLLIHLTNNAISRHCQEKDNPNFVENMWSLDQFKEYLSSTYQQSDLWESNLLSQLKNIIKLSMLSGWSKIEWRENSIGLFGFDVLIDREFKMWLLEINLCPSMEHSTKITLKLVPKMFEDLCKIIIDKNEGAGQETGDYELIYEGIKVTEEFICDNDLCIQGKQIFK